MEGHGKGEGTILANVFRRVKGSVGSKVWFYPRLKKEKREERDKRGAGSRNI